MMPRAASELFAHIGRDPLHMYTVTMSYIQIYMEMLQASCQTPLHCHHDHCSGCKSSRVNVYVKVLLARLS